jgi:predicted SprT family Zn-dependent metalloprotease
MKNEYPNPMVTYGALDHARDFFSNRLFDGEVRPCLITVQRRRTACGFFSPARFRSHDEKDIADEIGLDPRYWGPPRTDVENLATLVHEMAHLWQHHYGKPGRGGYHNRQFSRKMFEVGLVTSDTGKRGGKATGTRMSHYIMPGGRFDHACTELLKSGFVIPYVEIMSEAEKARLESARHRSRAASKTTYVCANCVESADPSAVRVGQSPDRKTQVRVWGKPGLNIVCGTCGWRLEIERSERKQRRPSEGPST